MRNNRAFKRLRKSELYKYVSLYKYKDEEIWCARMSETKTSLSFWYKGTSEKNAAIAVDKQLINRDKKPINVLIKKEII